MPNATKRTRGGFDELDDTLLTVEAPSRSSSHTYQNRFNDGLKLRGRRVPFTYEVNEEALYDGLVTAVPVGYLAHPEVYRKARRWNDGKFDKVVHAGGYQWNGPVMRRDVFENKGRTVAFDYKVTGVPDVLCDPTTVGQLDSDLDSGYVDYCFETKDAYFSHPACSPFDPLFRSLPSPTLLDSTDIIVDLTTLIRITDFLLTSPEGEAIRIDTEFTCPTAPVILHRWLPKALFGPGEPHRGWLQNYTERITARAGPGQRWKGGTTQVVRYELGGMSMLVRYPVTARLGQGGYGTGSGAVGIVKREVGSPRGNGTGSDTGSDDLLSPMTGSEGQGVEIDTPATTPDRELPDAFEKPRQASSSIQPASITEWASAVDRTRFVMIKVFTLNRNLDINDVYLRLAYSQIKHCLLAPHIKGQFNAPHENFTPSLHQVDDGFFDEVKTKLGPVIMAATGVLRDMISVTRKQGRGLSFIGKEDGTWVVHAPKTDYGEKPPSHIKLSGKGLEMMRSATPSTMATEAQKVTGFKPYDRSKTIGAWARLNAADPLVARWGWAHD